MTKGQKYLRLFHILIEQVLHTRNLNIVTPFLFKQNLVMYSVKDLEKVQAVTLPYMISLNLKLTLFHALVETSITKLIIIRRLEYVHGDFVKVQLFL